MNDNELTNSAATDPKTSIVRPQRLSHGTLLCGNLTRTRKFYEELFLEHRETCHIHAPGEFREFIEVLFPQIMTIAEAQSVRHANC